MAQTDPERAARRRAYSPVLRATDFRPLSSSVRVEFGAHSQARPSKEQNDDHYLILQLGRSQETILTSLASADVPQRFMERGYAMALADGIGGTGASALASRVAISTLVHLALHYGRWNVRIDSRAAFEIVERLDWYCNEANEVLKRRAKTSRYLSGMSTNLTAAYSAGDELFLAHTGRSLAYILRDGHLVNLGAGGASAEVPEIKRPRLVSDQDSELSSVLSDALGAPGRLVVSVSRFQVRDGDLLLLCTESLTAALSDEDIADTLADRRRPEDLCRRLTDAALNAHAVTSVTALLAQYHIPGRLL
jgi:protein phosphatase